MMRNPSHPRRGFTLLEIIASMAMFAVLTGAMLGVFNSSLRLRERADENITKGLQRDLVLQLLRRDLINIVAPAVSVEDPETVAEEEPLTLIMDFIGEVNNPDGAGYPTLEFTTTVGNVNDLNPWADLRRVQYRLEAPEIDTNRYGLDFVRKVTDNLLPVREDLNRVAFPEWRILTGVSDMTIEYYDLENEIWQTTWDPEIDGAPLPTLVRMQIFFVQPEEYRGATDLLRQPPLTVVAELTTEALEAATEETGEGGNQS